MHIKMAIVGFSLTLVGPMVVWFFAGGFLPRFCDYLFKLQPAAQKRSRQLSNTGKIEKWENYFMGAIMFNW